MDRQTNIIRFLDYPMPGIAKSRTNAASYQDDLHWSVDEVKRIIFDFSDSDRVLSKSIGYSQ